MSSQIANQNRIERISWAYNSNSSDTYSQRIVVPFLVDEIRVVSCGAQLTALNWPGGAVTPTVDPFGNSAIVSSRDLVGSSGGILGVFRTTYVERHATSSTTTNIGRSAFSAPCVFDSTNYRYVFPPSAKRNINGTFTFTITDLLGERFDNSIVNNFNVVLVLEFIQYKETEKQLLDVDDDLRVLGKSGRRRL